jgi:hypothetical protein
MTHPGPGRRQPAKAHQHVAILLHCEHSVYMQRDEHMRLPGVVTCSTCDRIYEVVEPFGPGKGIEVRQRG